MRHMKKTGEYHEVWTILGLKHRVGPVGERLAPRIAPHPKPHVQPAVEAAPATACHLTPVLQIPHALLTPRLLMLQHRVLVHMRNGAAPVCTRHIATAAPADDPTMD